MSAGLRPEADDERAEAARGDPGNDIGNTNATRRAEPKYDRQHLARSPGKGSLVPRRTKLSAGPVGIAQDSTPTGMVTSE